MDSNFLSPYTPPISTTEGTQPPSSANTAERKQPFPIRKLGNELLFYIANNFLNPKDILSLSICLGRLISVNTCGIFDIDSHIHLHLPDDDIIMHTNRSVTGRTLKQGSCICIYNSGIIYTDSKYISLLLFYQQCGEQDNFYMGYFTSTGISCITYVGDILAFKSIWDVISVDTHFLSSLIKCTKTMGFSIRMEPLKTISGIVSQHLSDAKDPFHIALKISEELISAQHVDIQTEFRNLWDCSKLLVGCFPPSKFVEHPSLLMNIINFIKSSQDKQDRDFLISFLLSNFKNDLSLLSMLHDINSPTLSLYIHSKYMKHTINFIHPTDAIQTSNDYSKLIKRLSNRSIDFQQFISIIRSSELIHTSPLHHSNIGKFIGRMTDFAKELLLLSMNDNMSRLTISQKFYNPSKLNIATWTYILESRPIYDVLLRHCPTYVFLFSEVIHDFRFYDSIPKRTVLPYV